MKIIIVITALITCLAVSNSSIANPKEKLILLDTIIYNKKVVLFYNVDSSFVPPLANTITYPMYVSINNQIDSYYNYIGTEYNYIYPDTEYEAIRYYEPNYYTDLLQMNVVNKKYHHTASTVVVDSSFFVELTYGADAYCLLRIFLNKKENYIFDKVVVSIYHFIIVPDDKVIGCSIGRGIHEGETLLLKFDKKNYYTTNIYLNYPSLDNLYLFDPPYENKPIKPFQYYYNKIKPYGLKKYLIKRFINKVGRYTFLGFSS